MLNQLLSNRVEKTPSTEVSADRYEYLALAEAEPDLGVPAANSYLLSSTTTGTRSWINPATNLPAPGSDKQVIFNNSGVLAAASGLVYDTATGRVGVGVTSPTTRLELAETWNNVATAFTHIKSNVTDTASAASSLLIDLQVGSLSKFRVGKDAQVSAGSFMIGFSPESTTNMSGLSRNGNNLLVTTVGTQAFNFSTSSFVSSRPIAIGPDAYTADTVINRDAADTLAQRRSTNAQTLRIYNTFTDASNYERVKIGWNTNVLEIGTENAGTGTLRNINFIGGNVGVNNSSPTQKLTVVGGNVSVDRGQTFGVLHLGNYYPIIGTNSSNKRVFGDLASNTGTRIALDIPGISLESNNNPIDFRNGALGAYNAVLTGAGNFGLGTTSPSAKLDVVGDIEVNSNVNLNSEATTLATVTKTQVASFAVASFRSGKLIAQAYDSVTGEVQISELLVAHNGTTATATEYGVVHTGATAIVTYDVDINSGNVRLMATRTSANSTQYKVSETLMVA